MLTFGLQQLPRQDIDGDALDDAWEFRYFANLDQDGGADADHDGLSDLQEYWAGTDPQVPDLVPLITFIQREPDGRVTLQWPAEVGRRYRVQFAEALDGSNWTLLPGEIMPATPVGRFEDFAPEVPRRFYRVLLNP